MSEENELIKKLCLEKGKLTRQVQILQGALEVIKRLSDDVQRLEDKSE